MFTVLVILLIFTIGGIIAGDPCEYDSQDGQPGCTTDIEMCKTLWRNNWDPTKYWECTQRGTPGVLRSCPSSEQFYEPILECVSKDIWRWTPMCDPPSKPETVATNKIGSAYKVLPPPCPYDEQDGQPGCKTALEICQRYWRNNWDPVRYWECEKQDVPAVLRNCVNGKLFYSPTMECIDLKDWKWTPMCDPPSKP